MAREGAGQFPALRRHWQVLALDLERADAVEVLARDLNGRCDVSPGILDSRWFTAMGHQDMNENELLRRITTDPAIFGGKPIVRGRRLAVEHVLGMLAAGDSFETLLGGYPWLEEADIRACLTYARRVVGHERIDPPLGSSAA